MRLVAEIRERLRAIFFLSREDRELDEELRFHLDMQTEEYIRRGMDPAEARRQAVLRLGGLAQVREATRDARGVRWLDDVVADTRYAFRTLLRRPIFTAAAAGTLALGIGGTTAIFGIVDALFLRPPTGVRGADTLARIYIVRDEGGIRTPDGGPGSYVDYLAMRDNAHGFSGVAVSLFPTDLDLDRGERAERLVGQAVSWNYLELLGVRPAIGRFFHAEEDSIQGAHPVAVLSHGYWRRRFGADSTIVGRTLLLNGQSVTVIGVAERGFVGAEARPIDAWVPMAMAGPLGVMIGGNAEWRTQPGMAVLRYVARLAPGVDREQAAASAAAALRHAAEAYPDMDPTPEVRLESVVHARAARLVGPEGVALLLMAVTGVVLVVACANIANLLLARSTARRREMAVRASLGAARGRLIRQNLTESVVLALLGGAVGVGVAAIGSGLARQFPLPPGVGGINGRVLAFAFAVSVLSGLLFGLAPALRAAGARPMAGLKADTAGMRPGRGRLRRALVTFQVTLCVLLLAGAGLMVQSLRQVLAIDTGLDIDRLLVVSVDLRNAGYPAAAREELLQAARDRLRQVPGVENAVIVHFTPLGGMSMSGPWDRTGADTAGIREGPYVNWVGAGYFATVGTRVLRGREFDEQDRAGTEPIVVINERLARALSPGGDPLGRCVPLGFAVREGGCSRVIGIVETARHRYLDEPTVPLYYLPWDRNPAATPPWGGPSILVRVRGRPTDLTAQVRAAVASLAPDLPYVSVQTMEDLLADTILPYRLGAVLFGIFSALALLIAAVGLYGVLAYFVAERTAEIGIRRSLGAQERNVVGLVLRQGMMPVAVGIGLGLGAALAAGRLIQALLYGVSAHDPVTLAGVAALLTAIALLACYLPARRAVRVDPMVALRAE
ncbi:MAG TPA: ABC transporter permease [Longimicrobiales bacterium]|nr:ABC transporter permease [Longimicrobiales bacterium]